jgi:hypothetical protein
MATQRLNVASRPAPFGACIIDGPHYATLVVFLLALGAMALRLSRRCSPSLRGTRDQPRRMNAPPRVGCPLLRVRSVC